MDITVLRFSWKNLKGLGTKEINHQESREGDQEPWKMHISKEWKKISGEAVRDIRAEGHPSRRKCQGVNGNVTILSG